MQRKTIEQVEIRQNENGYSLYIGPNCSNIREKFVFQSFTELVCFLNNHFTFRNELIYNDFNNQLSITLK
jgi:hypothetical protein